MDISRDLRKRKKEPEPTSEKPFQDSLTEELGNGEYFHNGKRVTPADDLKDLPEVDYNDPEVKKWIAETEERWRKNNPHLTHPELIEAVDRKIGKKI